MSTNSWEYFLKIHFIVKYSQLWKGLERVWQEYELKNTGAWKHISLSSFDSALTYAVPFLLLMIVKNLPKQQEPSLDPVQSPAKIRLLKESGKVSMWRYHSGKNVASSSWPPFLLCIFRVSCVILWSRIGLYRKGLQDRFPCQYKIKCWFKTERCCTDVRIENQNGNIMKKGH